METNPQTTEHTASTVPSAKKVKARRKMRRILAGALTLVLALTGAGLLANALTPDAQVATANQDDQALITEGKDLYEAACVTCHGKNLQGVKDRGPSLIGVGEGVRNEDGTIAMESLRGKNYDGEVDPADIARGSDLFRLNCASCHNFTGRGGALSSGKYAPYLDPANEQEIYQAMLTGPQNMPKFSDRQLSADEKKDIIAFIKAAKETPNPGGYGLGGIGPVTEGMLMWLVGIVVLIAAALWIGSRS